MSWPWWAQGQRVATVETVVPGFSATINNPTFSGVQSGTSSATLTVTRFGGFTGTVSGTFAGLPSGTTGALSPTTLPNGTTVSTITLTHGGSAATVTAQAFTLTLTSAGVPDVVLNGTVTVTAAGSSIALGASSTTFTGFQGGSSSRTVTLTRTNFTGEVTLAVAGLPTGTTANVSPSSLVGGDLTATVTLTHASNADIVTNDAFTITASGVGVSDAVLNCTLTVTAPQAFAPNLPAGFATLSDVTFESDYTYTDLGPGVPNNVTYKNTQITRFTQGRGALAVRGDAPSGTGYAIDIRRLRFREDGVTLRANGYEGLLTYALSTPSGQKQMYSAVSFFLPDTFENHPAGSKLFYPFARLVGANTTNTNFFTAILNIGGNALGPVRLSVQQVDWWNGSAFSAVSWENQGGFSFSNPYPLARNKWWRVETLMRLESDNVSSGPQADGILRMWVSEWTGTAWSTPFLLMNYTTMLYGSIAQMPYTSEFNTIGLNRRLYDLYHGGDTAPPVTQDNSMFVDRMAAYIAP